MRFAIEHLLHYRYSQQVYLEPHVLRVRPRNDATQRIVSFQMDMDPAPAGMTDGIDAAGNEMTLVWFKDLHEYLNIVINIEVDTLRENPWDFIIPRHRGVQLPCNYSPAEQSLLTPYLARPYASTGVDDFVRELVRLHNSQTLAFLGGLTDAIYRDFAYEVRHEGTAHRPELTLRQRTGSCRDLAVLFNDACRSVGLAARFVSGFAQTNEDEHQHELHAWSEVYLPGAGWRGYDPSHGLMAADCHVPVCSAPEASGATPVEGTFRGTGVLATLETGVRITRPGHVSQG